MSTRLFSSWVRRGAAAGIIAPDPTSGAFARPATFTPSITLARNGTALEPIAGPELPLIGPGAVVGLEAGAVVRTDPAAGATSVENNFLVLAELARPDLPWLFTPAKPDEASRLRPWLVLVVVQASKARLRAGTPLPRISVPESELPDLSDSWAWAHAQVTSENPADAASALEPPAGGAAVARLLCPRRLLPETTYLACIVPATRPGVQAGLSLPLDQGPAIAPAWSVGTGQDVVLPVYYSWTFTTGENGDFKSLVQRLHGIRPDAIAGFGTRTIDVSAPWQSDPQVGQGMTIELDGALGIGVDRPGTMTAEARATFENRLTRLLDFPADLTPAESNNDPALAAVAPPIYGARHAGQSRVPAAPSWLRTLNLDPRRRIAAALGTQYVQEHQEFLMARAWDQLGAVREANRLRALAELAATIGDRVHARHIEPLGTSGVLAVAAPARTRLLAGSTVTLQAKATETPLPRGSATVAFSRFARPEGPIGRRAFARARPTVIDQGLRGAVRAAPAHSALDGIATLATAPAVAARNDATARLAVRAWQQVSAIEQAVPSAGDLTALRQALDARVTPVGTGLAIGGGPPVITPPPPVAVPLDASSLATTVKSAMQPSLRILKRLDDRVLVPERLGGGRSTRRVMACPDFPAPLALALQQKNPDLLLPGLGNFPDDRVTLLVANTAFIESFMAGVNHEMNRELLWREYPTDQRGTPFCHFWPRPDGSPDIPPVTSWPLATALGKNSDAASPGIEAMVVLLVRGEVLRRYPRTIVYVAPGRIDGQRLTLDTAVPWTAPQFLLRLDARTTAFAYPLSVEDVHSDLPNGKAGMYFVFSEPVTGPRFNFDVTPLPAFEHWTDLDWDRIRPVRGFAVAGRDLAETPSDENGPGAPHWNRDSADVARIAFARPFRVGFHADELLARD